jgi:hypothetical protein
MSAGERLWLRRIGRAGLTARGITFAIIGWFLVQAALRASPGEAHGLAGALSTLGHQDHGPDCWASVDAQAVLRRAARVRLRSRVCDSMPTDLVA